MKILSVFDAEFLPYGKVLSGCDFAPLLKLLRETTPQPQNGVTYVPSAPALEALPEANELSARFYGGMPIQIGYCNGQNTRLNCLEYHRDSEVNITADDMVLLLAREQSLVEGRLSTAEAEAFAVPAGTAVELYATTLHYAPCCAKNGRGFRVIVVLPRGTNGAKPDITPKNAEDSLLWACNKWLLAHPDTQEARDGAFCGLFGENIDILNLIG